VAHGTGHAFAFVAAVLVVLIWIVTGPVFGFSDTWQLVINTGTTIVTFLMVFILQNTQNRDNQAVQLKLDEILRSLRHARTSFVDLEDLPDDELEALAEEFRSMHERARAEREARGERSRNRKR
jgi:low affinity Fe/Cu permease